MTAKKILEIARREIGVKESPANSNRVKYNTAYYGKEVSGSSYPWCCAFVWWVFREAGASALFYGGKKTAYCPTLKTYHKGQTVKGDYRPGDVIFFNFSGKANAAHVGVCESWDGAYITTIDGNTGTGDQANGGAVLRQKRSKKYIVGAYRPAYKEENEMTEEQVKRIARAVCAQLMELDGYPMFVRNMEKYRQELAKMPAPQWAVDSGEWDKAFLAGIVASPDRPHDLVTRAEAAAMALRGK